MIVSMLLFLVLFSAALILFISSKYKWWQPAIPESHPRILMYHMVREHISGAKFNGLRVPPAEFEKQIHWFHEKGWEFRFLSEIMQGAPVNRKTVVITFDDGYQDNYVYALPILKKHQAKATLFLVVDRENNDWSTKKKAHHDSGELVAEPKLSDEQVRKMIDSGYVEIGGHSLSHADFSKIDLKAKRHEIEESKRILEEKFGVNVSTHAYPFGIHDQEDQRLVESAGYIGAVTTDEGIDDSIVKNRYKLKRIKVGGKKNLAQFKLNLRTGISALF